jgi:hypothetical protein
METIGWQGSFMQKDFDLTRRFAHQKNPNFKKCDDRYPAARPNDP